MHALVGSLLERSITIMRKRYYICPSLILRIMQSHIEKEKSSDGVYFHALFGLLIPLSRTIRFTRVYFCPGLILR